MMANDIMNYGWLFAFLGVVFIVIFSFGFLSFGLFANMSCKMPSGFNCRQPEISTNELSFVVKNQRMVPIILSGVSLGEENCGSEVIFDEPVRLKHREGQKVVFLCDEFPLFTSGNVTISYKSEYTGLTFSEDGFIKFKRKEETALTRTLDKIRNKISSIDFKSIFFSSSSN